ncbi:MAG: hypothetical protein RLZZ621_2156 [Gemmatimonadota bacterium]|jgi:hypothetical protein
MRFVPVRQTVLRAAVLGVAMFTAAACKSAPKSTPETRAVVSTIPDWFAKPPVADDRFFGVATSESRDMQLAVDKATAASRAQIAQQLEVKFGGVSKRFQEETGAGNSELLDQFTQTYKLVSSQTLNGARAKEQKVIPGEGTYRAYVLMEMPVGEANKALMAKLAAQQALYTRFRATQAFKDLNEELEKYEAANKPPAKE